MSGSGSVADGIDPVDVLFLCTGNAARSVMAGTSLSVRRSDLIVETAGTIVIDGQPMSVRTRTAIADVGHPLPRHSSRQVLEPHLDAAALIVGLAPEHVAWVRRNHPSAAARTVTLRRLARDLAGAGSLADQVAAMALASVELEDWEEVVDPGGGETEVFVACAHEIDALIATVADRLGGRPS